MTGGAPALRRKDFVDNKNPHRGRDEWVNDMMVHRRDGLIEAEVDGELVALHVDNGACYGFNVTATRIWALIETPRRLSELKDRLLEEYDVDPQDCESQLMEMLKELERDGLVDLRPVSG
jgi:hypothetical protein